MLTGLYIMYSGLASSIDVALRSSFVLRPSSFVRQSYQTTTTERMDVNFAAASCDREDFLLLASLPLPSLFLSLALSLSLSLSLSLLSLRFALLCSALLCFVTPPREPSLQAGRDKNRPRLN